MGFSGFVDWVSREIVDEANLRLVLWILLVRVIFLGFVGGRFEEDMRLLR